MKELGEYLKRTRISNGVSLTEACEDLDFSTTQLENIESGNVRAFKDVYELRDSVKNYAKYLGLDADKVVDEFNGFLFQHTSRISLEDIRAAQKKKEELLEEKRVKSPYTIEHKERISLWPVVSILLAIVFITLIVLVIVSNINKHEDRTDELKSYVREERVI
ncbi:MAG: helix-turn-helix domain-containing protein [Bacilli bacterium]|nr:helix-turn-helix domain-containing protein [Bacilli bacterium]